MTVYNTGYSTLEEAWADSYLAPNLQKKKNRKKQPPQTDPLCDLYEMGNGHYTENDLLSFANKYYEKHDKAKYQKPMMNDSEHPREEKRYVDVGEDEDPVENIRIPERLPERQELPDQDYALQKEMAAAKKAKDDRMYFNTREYYVDDDQFESRNNNFNMYDVVLYIISGIILIFMMEQFVKIGMLMH